MIIKTEAILSYLVNLRDELRSLALAESDTEKKIAFYKLLVECLHGISQMRDCQNPDHADFQTDKSVQ